MSKQHTCVNTATTTDGSVPPRCEACAEVPTTLAGAHAINAELARLGAAAKEAFEMKRSPPPASAAPMRADSSAPCCNPECGGDWGTGCDHCHYTPRRCGCALAACPRCAVAADMMADIMTDSAHVIASIMVAVKDLGEHVETDERPIAEPIVQAIARLIATARRAGFAEGLEAAAKACEAYANEPAVNEMGDGATECAARIRAIDGGGAGEVPQPPASPRR